MCIYTLRHNAHTHRTAIAASDAVSDQKIGCSSESTPCFGDCHDRQGLDFTWVVVRILLLTCGALRFLANGAEPHNSSFSLSKEHIGCRDSLCTQQGLHHTQMECSYISNPARQIIKAGFLPIVQSFLPFAVDTGIVTAQLCLLVTKHK